MQNSNKSKFLLPETVSILDSMSLRARLVVEGYIIGQHRSPFHGFSVEFAEHRSYEPEMKFVILIGNYMGKPIGFM
ncbi:MAG: hypothetical protein CM15mP44_0950 [Candidatus Neomarinimicrobiota bacterium]|nr:MAG: hypothetical protein CM15mP44_0950 [Candidatus Neomarinimicrobiota bacterium]